MEKPYFYRIVRPIIKFLFILIYRPKIKGASNIPKEGGVILAGNHTNNFDCLLLLSSTKRTIHFLAKDSLNKGLKKIIFKNMGIIPVNRKVHDSNVILKSDNMLREKKVIGIFPEGTINRTDEILMPFKYGTVKMARDTSSTIVPFCITGKYKLFNSRLQIKFLDAYKLNDDTTLEEENNKLMNMIKDTLIKEGK